MSDEMQALREHRNKLLAECDWTQSRDVTLSNDNEWKTYTPVTGAVNFPVLVL